MSAGSFAAVSKKSKGTSLRAVWPIPKNPVISNQRSMVGATHLKQANGRPTPHGTVFNPL